MQGKGRGWVTVHNSRKSVILIKLTMTCDLTSTWGEGGGEVLVI